MKPSPVRELARRYAAGESSLEEYRKQRRHMIDAVCAGTLTIEYGESTPRRVRSRKPLWLIVIPVIVVIVIGILIVLQFGSAHRVRTEVIQSPQAATLSGIQLLHTFTDSNDWSGTSISAFLQQWQRLPASEKQAARNSYLFPRLLSQLHEQITSQQAMLELAPDPKTAQRHLAQLRQLAAALENSQAD